MYNAFRPGRLSPGRWSELPDGADLAGSAELSRAVNGALVIHHDVCVGVLGILRTIGAERVQYGLLPLRFVARWRGEAKHDAASANIIAAIGCASSETGGADQRSALVYDHAAGQEIAALEPLADIAEAVKHRFRPFGSARLRRRQSVNNTALESLIHGAVFRVAAATEGGAVQRSRTVGYEAGKRLKTIPAGETVN